MLPFTTVADWPEIWCLMEVSSMFDILQILRFYLVRNSDSVIGRRVLNRKYMHHLYTIEHWNAQQLGKSPVKGNGACSDPQPHPTLGLWWSGQTSSKCHLTQRIVNETLRITKKNPIIIIFNYAITSDQLKTFTRCWTYPQSKMVASHRQHHSKSKSSINTKKAMEMSSSCETRNAFCTGQTLTWVHKLHLGQSNNLRHQENQNGPT